MNKMLYDSNSVSLMSIDNSSSSEPTKKFSPVKFASNIDWWEEVEAAEQTVFKQEDTDTEVTQETNKCIKTENEGVTTMDPEMLTFTNKINVKDENDDVNKDETEYQFLDRTNESNDSTASNSREITLEFLDSSNGDKYDRLVRDVKIKTPFKRRLSGDSRSNSPISFFPLENDSENANDDAEPASIGHTAGSTEDNRAGSATSSHTTGSTGRSHAKRRRCNQQIETNVEVLARRQKQIEYGKNTIGYDNYIKQIPRNKRTKDHPWTPPKQFKYSRRAFDGLIKGWRTKLHCFDPPNYKGTKDETESSESGEEDDEK